MKTTIKATLFRDLVAENKRLTQELSRLRAELIRDDLTGLYNSRHLRLVLQEKIHAVRREGEGLSLIFLDVDRFKDVNEIYGHAAAGRILEQVGRVLSRCVRADDLVFRYAGDEFVVLVKGDEKLARRVGERIRESIENHRFRAEGFRDSNVVRVTASLGVRSLRAEDSAESLLAEADRAMFEAKRRSRNTLVAA